MTYWARVSPQLIGFELKTGSHGNVSLRFCIVSSNELVVLDSLENSKQVLCNLSVCEIRLYRKWK